jgi:hypothetical protein
MLSDSLELVSRLQLTTETIDLAAVGSTSITYTFNALGERVEAWRWSRYKNFALDRKTVADCPIQIDYLRLPLGYRG